MVDDWLISFTINTPNLEKTSSDTNFFRDTFCFIGLFGPRCREETENEIILTISYSDLSLQ